MDNSEFGSLILNLSFVGGIVLGGFIYIARVRSRRAPLQEEPWPQKIAARGPDDLEKKRDALMDLMVRRLGVSREKLTPDADFRKDFRVPPGELAALLEIIEDGYEVRIDPDKIRTVKDLLGVVRLKWEEVEYY